MCIRGSYNPLAIRRTDTVEARVVFDGTPPPSLRVFGPTGEIPSQVVSREGASITVLFLADVAPTSWSVVHARPPTPGSAAMEPSPVSQTHLTLPTTPPV